MLESRFDRQRNLGCGTRGTSLRKRFTSNPWGAAAKATSNGLKGEQRLAQRKRKLVDVLSARVALVQCNLGFPPDADGNGNYAFFDAANYALIQMTGGVTAISAV